MAGLDFNNPVVAVAAIVAVVLLLDLLMAGGAATSHAACGVAHAMSTHAGWLGILLVAGLAWLAFGGPPVGAVLSPAGGTILLLVGVLLVVVVSLVLAVVWSDRANRPRLSAAEVLRLRYSRGELSRQEYRQMQLDVLKDRYVRGDLSIEAYEVALGRLFEEPKVGRSSGALSASPVGSAPDVLGDAAH